MTSRNCLAFLSHAALVASVLALTAPSPLLAAAGPETPPSPRGVTPSPRQLAWHAREFYGFLHFTVNTFTDREWGNGDESPAVFHPSALDARQWARTARDAGMKALILTAKHHDGFCLWPSQFTEHSVKHSPWRDGKGDVVREFVDACREFNLECGVYLSPWDRNHAQYGRAEYVTYYRNQLRELLTNYGPLCEVWFDGANGGDGYYGGARETRRIDNATYYDWPNTWKIVRELQPNAVMFSDAGPDVRWVGNESGVAFENSWMALDQKLIYPGYPEYGKFAPGQMNGSDWVPPEVDVSIRPGWFYHPAEDAKVKSVRDLVEIYYASVGRSASLLLNLPPDRRGLIHETDGQRLRDFAAVIAGTFRENLAVHATATASHTRAGSAEFSPAKVLDGKSGTYWATDDNVHSATVELAWAQPQTFDRVQMQEFLPLGQRIQAWAIEAQVQGAWKTVGSGKTIAYKRLVRCERTRTDRLRFRFEGIAVCPAISEVGVYLSTDEPR